MSHSVVKGIADIREYRAFTLSNKLSVLIASEPTTDKAAAALDVGVGAQSDPEEWPGLAHFCEHMLFLGTEKYPKENYYDSYLSSHGGRSNASTSAENTNYYFDVKKDNLKEALDIFAQFFISPLFSHSGTDREMNAVNSENDKNFLLDSRRFRQILKAESNQKSPFHKFTTGNLETLNKDGIRDSLLAFYNKHYSANLMKLTVLGSESLDTLEAWVRELFSSIPNKDLQYDRHPEIKCFESDHLKKVIYYVPVKDLRTMTLLFPIQPSYAEAYRKKPSRYYSHLLGHEGEGSLFSILKTKGWVSKLTSGSYTQTNDYEIFMVEVELTESGFDKKKEILDLSFKWINLVNQGPQKWIFDELQNMGNISFQFLNKKPPADFCSSTAYSMHRYTPEEYLSGPYLLKEYDPEMLKTYGKYINPENLILIEMSKSFENIAKTQERWYKAMYHVDKLNEDWIKDWKGETKDEELNLPDPNPFIPDDLSLKPGSHKTEEEKKNIKEDCPTLLVKTNNYELWHLQDRTFERPKAYVSLQFVIPSAYTSPQNQDKAQLFTMMLKDILSEFTYQAEVAGLSFSISPSWPGLELHVAGYNQNLGKLVKKLLETLANLELREDRFKVQSFILKRDLQNFFKDQPYTHAQYFLNSIIVPRWSVEERLDCLEKLKFEDVVSFKPSLLSNMFINIFSHGNITSDEAKNLVGDVESILKPQPLFKSEWPRRRLVKLNKGVHYVFSNPVPNSDNENSAILVWFPVTTEFNYLIQARLLLLADIIKEPCYDTLRTKEQLGYIVNSSSYLNTGVYGIKVLIQSSVKDPIGLDERIEEFLKNFKNTLASMSESDFKTYVDSRIAKYLQKANSLSELHNKYWEEIKEYNHKFYRSHELAELTKSITLQEINDLFNRCILDENTRRKISSRVFGKNHALTLQNDSEKLFNITEPTEWKHTMPLYPAFTLG